MDRNAATAAAPRVTLRIGRGILGGEVVRTAAPFVRGETVYAWTEVEGVTGSVQHIWIHDGVAAARYFLPVRPPCCRTWSRRRLGRGRWVVEVRGPHGSLLCREPIAADEIEQPSGC